MLDPVATQLWAALTGARDWPAARHALTARFDVDAEVLAGDCVAFATRCRAAGLLQPADAPAPPPHPPPPPPRPWRSRLPGALHALILLHGTARSLARHGMAATYARAATATPAPAHTATAHTATATALGPALARFGMAENLFVSRRGPDDCLVRSLALFRFLRERGVPARHVIGVCRLPFQAHAWVEHDGRPLLDTQGSSTLFTPIAHLE